MGGEGGRERETPKMTGKKGVAVAAAIVAAVAVVAVSSIEEKGRITKEEKKGWRK